MKITVEEYTKLIEKQARLKAFKDFAEVQPDYNITLSKKECIAILGLNTEEVKNEAAKETDIGA